MRCALASSFAAMSRYEVGIGSTDLDGGLHSPWLLSLSSHLLSPLVGLRSGSSESAGNLDFGPDCLCRLTRRMEAGRASVTKGFIVEAADARAEAWGYCIFMRAVFATEYFVL